MADIRFKHQVFAGIGSVWTITLQSGSFTGAESLSAKVYPGGNVAATFTPTAAWLNATAAKPTLTITYSAANTATVTPNYYEIEVSLADSSAMLAVGDVQILATPGSGTADLVGSAYVRAALADLSLTTNQIEFLPTAVSMASDAVRQYCSRWFTRRTTTLEYQPTYDGRLMLTEMPVNEITRLASDREAAITVTASTTQFQQARVYFSTTGDRISGLTVTGLNLVSVASGVATTTNLLFATYTTVAALNTAINAVSGWTATVAGNYGAWGTNQLIGGDAAQGALTDGATLYVYATDLSDYRVDWQTGSVWLNNANNTTNNQSWGPLFDLWDYPRPQYRTVQVTHDLGFDTIPASVQQATAETVKQALIRLALDETVKSEHAGQYSYTVADMIGLMTPPIRQLLSVYRITNA